jgi:hypothetical protein
MPQVFLVRTPEALVTSVSRVPSVAFEKVKGRITESIAVLASENTVEHELWELTELFVSDR